MIRIIRGVYGYLDKDGIVRPKTEADAPFALLPEQEARLVRLGVAQYVETVKSTPVLDTEQVEAGENQASSDLDETPTDNISLADLSAKELREIGKEYGISFKVGMSKVEMVKAIEEAEADLNAEDEDDEPAPVFDASEAVQ